MSWVLPLDKATAPKSAVSEWLNNDFILNWDLIRIINTDSYQGYLDLY